MNYSYFKSKDNAALHRNALESHFLQFGIFFSSDNYLPHCNSDSTDCSAKHVAPRCSYCVT